MDVFQRSVTFAVFLLLLSLSVFVAMPDGDCAAGYPCNCCLGDHHPYFDGSVRAAWSRTWHAPTPWSTPLTPYYVPRTPPYGCEGDFAGCASRCGANVESCSGDLAEDLRGNGEYCGVEGGFERIGQIPNELGIAGPAPPSAPPTPPR
jgi:hypothetical protein